MTATFQAVVTTGIYCRDGCNAHPHPRNVRTYTYAAAAEADGFRACLRSGRTAAPDPIRGSAAPSSCAALYGSCSTARSTTATSSSSQRASV